MYACDPAGAHYIRKFNSSGGFIKNIGGFNGPSGIDFDSSGNFYFSNYYENKVYKYSSADTLVTSWNITGPQGVAVDSSDNIYVVSSTNHRIYKYNSSGTAITNWGGSGSGNGQLNGPNGIAIDNYDNIYVVDTGNYRVQKFNTSGTCVDKFGSQGSADGQFTYPYFVEVNGTGRIYVVDYLGYDVQYFTDDSLVLPTSTPTPTPTATNTPTPTSTPANTPTPTVTPTNTPTPTPTDSSTPLISLISANPSSNSVTVSWTTDETSSTIIEYGLTYTLGETTSETDTSPRVTSHSVTLNSLKPCARYHYRVKSSDASNNQAVSSSSTFATGGCAASVITDGTASSLNTSGGSVILQNGLSQATLSMPNGFSSETTTIQINKLATSAQPTAPTNTSLAKANYYDLIAVTNSGTQITSFSQPVTFTITYGSDTESSFLENSLDVYKYTGNEWEPKSCTLNTSANTLTCTLSSFSVYAVFGQSTQTTSNESSTTASSAKPPACQDEEPNSTPDLFQIDTNGDKATIYFTPIANTNKYFISYSLKHGAEDYGTEVTLGSNGVQNYTVNYLATNSEYFFKVRGQKGCMPGDWSNILTARTFLNRSIVAYKYTPSAPHTNNIIASVPPNSESRTFNQAVLGMCSYIVRPGDSLWKIAESTTGNPYNYVKIKQINDVRIPDINRILHAGWNLAVPCK